MAEFSLSGDGQDYQAIDLPSGGPLGATLVSGASANTKGAWVTLGATASFDASGLALSIHHLTDTSGSPPTGVGAMVDLAVGAASSEIVIVPNLYWVAPGVLNGQTLTGTLFLPLAIPAGSTLSARFQSVNGTATTGVSAILLSQGFSASAPGNEIEAWGCDTSSTSGVNLTPAGGYVTLKGSTTFKADWLVLAPYLLGSFPASGATKSFLIDIAVGGVGSEVNLISSWPVTFNALGLGGGFSPPLPVAIPAGTRVSARCVCPAGVSSNISLVAYALGG